MIEGVASVPGLQEEVFRGAFWAAVGVGFWIAGPVIGFFVWEYYRGD